MNGDLHGLSGAYAVDAVDDAERARFEIHLAECAECRDEVASLRAAAAGLAAVASVAPPASLKAAIMRDIAAVRPLPPLLVDAEQKHSVDTRAGQAPVEQQPVEQPPAGQPPAGQPPAAQPPAGQPPAGQPPAGQPPAMQPPPGQPPPGQPPIVPATVSGLEAARSSRAHRADRGRHPVRGWLAGAAAAAVLAVGGLIWHPWSIDEPGTRSLTEQVLQASDAQRFPKTVGNATATIVRSEIKRRAVILTENMPPAPAGHVYQLWLQQPNGSMTGAGFMPTGNQKQAAVVLDGDAATAIGAGITVEPAGGSPAPTTQPLVLFAFT